MGNQACCDGGAPQPQFQQGRMASQPSLLQSSSHSLIEKPSLSNPIKQQLEVLKPFQNQLPKRLRRTRLNGQIYEGQTDDGSIANGYGRLFKSNGSLFIGKFLNGKVEDHEEGYYFNPDGSYYYGKFVDNQANDDSGKYQSESFTYKGGFKNNKFNGKGREEGENYEFDGEYQNDKRKEGTLIWNENGVELRYTGQFNSAEKFQGKGILEQASGRYIGEFLNGKKHGKGEYIYKSRLKYEGEYRDGKKEGQGKIYNSDGSISYQGEWRKGLPDGKGATLDKNGSRMQSQFYEGIDMKFMQEQQASKIRNSKMQNPP